MMGLMWGFLRLFLPFALLSLKSWDSRLTNSELMRLLVLKLIYRLLKLVYLCINLLVDLAHLYLEILLEHHLSLKRGIWPSSIFT
jgi:hypothetical protein